MSVTVYCGNGGDWEFENDRAMWRLWIKKNITTQSFDITAHNEADKAVVVFDNDKWDLFFMLKKPEYITYEDIRE